MAGVFALMAPLAAAHAVSSYEEVVPTRRAVSRGPRASPPGWHLLPPTELVQAVWTTDCVAGGAGRKPDPALLGENGEIYGWGTDGPVAWAVEPASALAGRGARLGAVGTRIAVAVTPTAAWTITCSPSVINMTAETACKCLLSNEVSANFGEVAVVAVSASMSTVWVAAANGLFAVEDNLHHPGSRTVVPVLTEGPVAALALSPDLVAAGGKNKLFLLNATSKRVLRWEWATDPSTGAGGALGGAVTALTFAGSDGAPELWIGSAQCLNVLRSNGAIDRVDGDAGLPAGNITGLAAMSDGQLWIGTTSGLVISRNSNDGPLQSFPFWSYLQGPRWLANSTLSEVATFTPLGTTGFGSAVVSGPTGATVLERQQWTLSEKAKHYHEILTTRHDRHGMTSGCTLLNYGDTSSCVMSDDDNNGLWTSLIVAAAYMQYTVEPSTEVLAMASRFFSGMTLLNNVTGTPGLMARSCCSPAELAAHTCGNGSSIHDSEQWHTSKDPDHKGWVWKGDTSSDEVVGHIFALSIVGRLSPLEWERALASRLLRTIVSGIIQHGFEMFDVTGKPTTWARWSPRMVNGDRAWSDERGLQSLQILSFIAAAATAPGVTAAELATFRHAYAELTNATNAYDMNMLNLRIKAPCDINYSDDELTFLPFYTYLAACNDKKSCPFDPAPVQAALHHTYSAVEKERSALWASIYGAVATDLTPTNHTSATRAAVWNLQTWPLSLIDWPLNNEHRLDIVWQTDPNRFGKTGGMSSRRMPPLPANERGQFRWNADPYDVTSPGNGMTECDPGAWLLPFWLSKMHRLL